uniref:Heparan-alpha-glucosaminide N-acetyltransferase n=1 Tax=Rhizophora mucronata TaxID=61149 RepID=A0A2P2M3V8_RHIMU
MVGPSFPRDHYQFLILPLKVGTFDLNDHSNVIELQLIGWAKALMVSNPSYVNYKEKLFKLQFIFFMQPTGARSPVANVWPCGSRQTSMKSREHLGIMAREIRTSLGKQWL